MNQRFDDGVQAAMARTRVLLLVATLGERDAVLEVAREAYGLTAYREPRPPYVVFRLGELAGTDITLAQAVAGPYSPSGVPLVTADLVRQLRPHHVILTGTCFGLKEKAQSLGDVVVCTQVRDLDHRALVEAGPGTVQVQSRGLRPAPSVMLSQAYLAGSADWVVAKVHSGPIVASGALFNSPTARAELRLQHPDAVAGDMESHTLAAACAKENVDWIAVRGISDWGAGKDDAHRTEAATNAADYVLHVIHAGLLGRPKGW
jgi:nucleoside phosphorylase